MPNDAALVSDELTYMNRTMNPEPVNLPLSAVAMALTSGNPVVVILEPGDATRYRLCLVPCWAAGLQADLGDVGIPQQNAREYLLVTRFGARRGEGFFAWADVQAYDLESVENEWSRELLSWWLRRLWKELEKVHA